LACDDRPLDPPRIAASSVQLKTLGWRNAAQQSVLLPQCMAHLAQDNCDADHMALLFLQSGYTLECAERRRPQSTRALAHSSSQGSAEQQLGFAHCCRADMTGMHELPATRVGLELHGLRVSHTLGMHVQLANV